MEKVLIAPKPKQTYVLPLAKHKTIHINPKTGMDISGGCYRFLIGLVLRMDENSQVRTRKPKEGPSTFYLFLRELIQYGYIKRVRAGVYKVSKDFAVKSAVI